MSILVIAEHDNTELKASTLNALTAASEIGGDIDLLVAGSNCGSVTEAANKYLVFLKFYKQIKPVTPMLLQKIWVILCLN